MADNIAYGNIHVLRKHKGGREGVSQMLTFAYVGGGGLRGHAYVIITWNKMLNYLHYLPNLNKNSPISTQIIFFFWKV